MSIAQGTTHYGYPQVQLTDRPTFADFNPAFNDIDAKLYSLITGATTDHAAIGELQTGLGETNTLLASVKLTADAAKAKADTNEENIGILSTGLSNTNRTVATKLDSVAIAEPYDPDAGTYAVGDIVVYNGQRYRCTTAVAVSEPFDADKWTGEDVETVLEGITGDVGDVSSLTTTDKSSCVAAINELNSELHSTTPDVTYAPVGTVTMSVALDALYALIDPSKLTAKSKIVNENGEVLNMAQLASGAFRFGRVSTNSAGTEMSFSSVILKASGSQFVIASISSGATSFSDISSGSSWSEFNLYY